MRVLTWLVSHAAAVTVAAWLIPGIWFEGATDGQPELADKWLPVLGVALILGLVSLYVEPVVKFFAFPFIVLTIGLLLLVINAGMLMLTAWIADAVGIGFHVDGFWNALIGSVVITIVTGFVDLLVDDED